MRRVGLYFIILNSNPYKIFNIYLRIGCLRGDVKIIMLQRFLFLRTTAGKAVAIWRTVSKLYLHTIIYAFEITLKYNLNELTF